MKCLLIPVDFSITTLDTLQYVADFSSDFPVEKIILFKAYHVSLLAQLLPSPDMIQLGADQISEDRQAAQSRFLTLSERFKQKLKQDILVTSIFLTDNLSDSLSQIIEENEPSLIVIGNDITDHGTESMIKEELVSIAKLSMVPVLLIPTGSRYKKPERVLLPTSFENLERLISFKKLCQSQSWLSAEILALNVDAAHRHDEVEDSDEAMLKKYLEGFRYGVHYTYGSDTAAEILAFAVEYQVQVILALPGRHSFFFNLTHKSVTKKFALEAHFPVLLLK